MIGAFERLRQRLESREPLSAQEKDVNFARGMDFWGIMDGDLLDEAAAISCQSKRSNNAT
jgi:hypothetical protein